MTLYDWINRREHGFRPNIGDEDAVLKCVYNSFTPYKTWNWEEVQSEANNSEFGAIFNLEFSPEGNILVAACEKKSVILFDPVTTKLTKTIKNAHMDNVNCIKFLDNRMFATCSDDTTVALWDTRNLKNKIRSLQGHSNWVKNIEYSQKDGLLVTSGFDGSIYTWDINSYTEQGFIYQKVFHTSGLMRCRISPDATKLIICTTGGYLIIIHNLDLSTLAKDLCGFRPNIYRLMQLGRQFIPQAAKFDHVFSKAQKMNRVELISDFPEHNDAEVVCALQIHPQGWCALSRNISSDEASEWSCVHDILEREDEKYGFDEDDNLSENDSKRKRKFSETEDYIPDSVNIRTSSSSSTSSNSSFSSSNFENIASASTSGESGRESNSGSRGAGNGRESNSNRNETFVPDIWAAEVTVQDRACRTLRGGSRSSNALNAYAYVYAISSGVITAPPNRNSSSDWNIDSVLGRNGSNRNDSINGRGDIRDHAICMSIYDQQNYQNIRRLLYYVKEPNRGKGYIKEPSFSADGRIICSPFDLGVRLLAFSDECSDFRGAVLSSKGHPEQLKEIKKIHCHSDIVVSTKFSPRYPLLVTGCLRGNVVWHHPDF